MHLILVQKTPAAGGSPGQVVLLGSLKSPKPVINVNLRRHLMVDEQLIALAKLLPHGSKLLG